MLGRQHLKLTAATTAALLTPFTEYTSLVLVAFIGACIGSLIPDIDAENATIFHTKINGINYGADKIVNNFIAPILPVFGYTTKYLMFIPAVKIYNKVLSEKHKFETSHRSFTHSLIGITTLTATTGLFMLLILLILGKVYAVQLLSFLLGYITGGVLHLIQDSCTKTGVAWTQPFSQIKIKGEHVTGENLHGPKLFLIYLLAIALASTYIKHAAGSMVAALYVTPFTALSWAAYAGITAEASMET